MPARPVLIEALAVAARPRSVRHRDVLGLYLLKILFSNNLRPATECEHFPT